MLEPLPGYLDDWQDEHLESIRFNMRTYKTSIRVNRSITFLTWSCTIRPIVSNTSGININESPRLGCGMTNHARAINDIRGAKLVACFDTIRRRQTGWPLRQVAGHIVDEMLADREVTVVTIGTPRKCTRPAIAARGQTRHLEKPG